MFYKKEYLETLNKVNKITDELIKAIVAKEIPVAYSLPKYQNFYIYLAQHKQPVVEMLHNATFPIKYNEETEAYEENVVVEEALNPYLARAFNKIGKEYTIETQRMLSGMSICDLGEQEQIKG